MIDLDNIDSVSAGVDILGKDEYRVNGSSVTEKQFFLVNTYIGLSSSIKDMETELKSLSQQLKMFKEVINKYEN